METNPYAAPSAVVEDSAVFGRDDLEARKSGRGTRLGAKLLDGIIGGVCFFPLSLSAIAAYGKYANANNPALHNNPFAHVFSLPVLIGAGLLTLALIVVNCVLLHRYGQTIGKRTVGIKIVRSNGERIGLSRLIFARTLPIWVMNYIPVVGPLVALVDPLLIFGAEKRCLHDLIADTIVIDV